MKFTWPKFLTYKKRPQAEQDNSDSVDEEISASRNRSVTPIAPLQVAAKANRRITFTSIASIAPLQSSADLTTASAANESFSSNQNISTPTFSPSTLSRPMIPAVRRIISESSSQPDRSATPFQAGMAGRVKCQSLTQKGLQCKNAAVVGSDKCRIHK